MQAEASDLNVEDVKNYVQGSFLNSITTCVKLFRHISSFGRL